MYNFQCRKPYHGLQRSGVKRVHITTEMLNKIRSKKSSSILEDIRKGGTGEESRNINISTELSTSAVLASIESLRERVLEILDIKDAEIFYNETVRSNLFRDFDKRDKLISSHGLTDALGFVRINNADCRHSKGSVHVGYGIHIYETQGENPIRYAIVTLPGQHGIEDVLFVEKGKTFRLHRQWAKQLAIHGEINKPVLPPNMLEDIEKNTVKFLQNSKRFKAYNTVARRGIVLSGSPGNGKTMVCRYLRELCNKNNIHYTTITASDIESAYVNGHLENTMNIGGIMFFDDIDISIFSRKKGDNSKMACAMLAAMDGMDNENSCIRIFTTNEMLYDMDPAFKRPGRIDKVFEFEMPNDEMRKKLLHTWPEDIIEAVDTEKYLESTDGLSFAEINSIKSIMATEHIIEGTEFNFDNAFDIMMQNKNDKDNGRNMKKGSAGFHGNPK